MHECFDFIRSSEKLYTWIQRIRVYRYDHFKLSENIFRQLTYETTTFSRIEEIHMDFNS